MVTIVTVYVYCCTWRLVTYGTSRAPRPPPWSRRPEHRHGSLLSRCPRRSRPPSRRRRCGSALRPDWGTARDLLTWKYASSVVPSQTGGLVHAQAIKSDSTPLQSTIKLFVWAGISIKTFGTKKIEELNHARECRGSTSQPWKGMTFYAVQCFRLSYSDWRSNFRIFLPIHKSVARRNMSHQVSSTDREFYST